ncbi:MAG: hypothetical protein ACRDWN_07665 [Acidimicrobiales bacterium]
MGVVADSHAIVWYVQGSTRLSEPARAALAEAEAAGDLAVSVATLVDLWYVTQSTAGVTADQLQTLQERLVSSEKVTLEPVSLDVVKGITTESGRPGARAPAVCKIVEKPRQSMSKDRIAVRRTCEKAPLR